MKPHEIKELLTKMVGDAVDASHTVQAFEAVLKVHEFYSDRHMTMYDEDPMSQHAPSECFDLHMREYNNLRREMEQRLHEAQLKAYDYDSDPIDALAF
jgi:hypothetical protein